MRTIPQSVTAPLFMKFGSNCSSRTYTKDNDNARTALQRRMGSRSMNAYLLFSPELFSIDSLSLVSLGIQYCPENASLTLSLRVRVVVS